MRLPDDDPLVRLRATPSQEVEAKPVPKEAMEASKRKTFMRSKYCRVGCTSPNTPAPAAAPTSGGGVAGRRWAENRRPAGDVADLIADMLKGDEDS